FWWIDPLGLGAPALRAAACLVGAWAVGRHGAKKEWWTLGDYLNLQDASVLRGKVAIVRGGRPPGPLLRGLLALADPTIRGFMRSRTVRTIFVDRRPGEEARRARARAQDEAGEWAARPEPVWIFFEGGRTKQPGTIAPARRGVGALTLALRDRGLDPLLVAVSHRGMERLIPPGGDRFLSFGHRVDVAWSEVEVPPPGGDPEKEAQALADRIREEVVRLQSQGASG
ncbi:MAG: 1-acyl-sn-glycerol-3-phosphate acyltransferase, partial [Myxococcota bacterium]